MESADDKIMTKIKKARRGSLFFTEDFLHFGSTKAVSKALERLVQSKKLNRIARGIYARLKFDPILGPLMPSVDKIAQAIRKRDKARIVPSGALALNLLGLSEQIPTNHIYLTDGAARKIDLGKQSIVFKKTVPRYLACIGEISSLVIQALKAKGKDNLSAKEKAKIVEILKREKPNSLKHDINLAPEWMRVIMKKALQE